jgi:anti-sigma factor RsiW
MNPCDAVRAWIHPYIDGEVGSEEQFALEAHLLECHSCRAEYESIRHVVGTARGSKPLYPQPASLQAMLEHALKEHGAIRRRQTLKRFAALAGCMATVGLFIAVAPMLRPQQFTSFAADAHLRYSKGTLPLAVTSGEPRVVSEWLEQYLPFHLALPNFPSEVGERKNYSLVGARSIQFGGREVAFLGYEMDRHPISLLVASEADVVPSGGETYRSGGLLFHFSSEKGLKLITWRDRGLSYALVSDVQVSAARSCIVCHGSRTDRQKFENLFPVPERN